jgi:rod shape-determining protein MreD
LIASVTNFNPWRAAAFLVPLVSIFVTVLMMPLPIAFKFAGYWLEPSLPLVAIFLWTMYRPDLLPPLAVLVLGMIMDLLVNGPMGVSALSFLTAYSIVGSQRLYWLTLPRGGVLVGFIMVMLSCGAVSWLATSFAYGRVVSPVPVLLEGMMSVIAFPIMRQVFGPLQRLAGPAL